MDIGTLDATLHLGFPGSIASLWQQAGRSGAWCYAGLDVISCVVLVPGRSTRPSLSILIAHDGVLDQHFSRRPAELFLRKAERVSSLLASPALLADRCPSFARPF